MDKLGLAAAYISWTSGLASFLLAPYGGTREGKR